MWSEIETRWSEFIHLVRAAWPETDRATLGVINGDRAALARHIAAVHDLTLREAIEAIEDWLFRVAGPARA